MVAGPHNSTLSHAFGFRPCEKTKVLREQVLTSYCYTGLAGGDHFWDPRQSGPGLGEPEKEKKIIFWKWGRQTFSVKCQGVNILGSVGHEGSVGTSLLL